MRRRMIKYVRDLWTNPSEREATWELEETQKKYPDLFKTGRFMHSCLVTIVEAAEFEDEFF
jgi:hypothetical protein